MVSSCCTWWLSASLILNQLLSCSASVPFRNGSVVYFQEDSVLRSNGTVCGAVAAGRLPNIILQVGRKRTASTLQFATILLMAQLMCPNATIKTGFVHHTRKIAELIEEQPNPNILQIYKTHTWEHISELPANAWVFMSVNNEQNASKAVAYVRKTFNHDVAYVQNMTFIRNNSIGDMSAYLRHFRLSEFPAIFFAQALNKFRLMRICCGSQMSSSWRDVLMHPAALRKGAKLHLWILSQKLSHKNYTIPASHMCDNINLNEMEKELFAQLEKMNIPVSLLPFGIHSPLVPYVGWCECTVQLTHQKKLDLNSFQYKLCEQVTYTAPRKAPKNIIHLINKYKLSVDDDELNRTATESKTKSFFRIPPSKFNRRNRTNIGRRQAGPRSRRGIKYEMSETI